MMSLGEAESHVQEQIPGAAACITVPQSDRTSSWSEMVLTRDVVVVKVALAGIPPARTGVGLGKTRRFCLPIPPS